MADCIQRLAQDIMNSDRLWSQLTPDGKIRMLRISMGLPPAKSSVHSPIKSEPAEQLREKHDRSFFMESEARLQRMDDCIREIDAILQRMQKTNQDFLAKSQKQQEGQPRSIEELGTSYQNQSKFSDFGVPLGDQADEFDMSGNGSVNSSQETSDQSNFVETIEDARKVLDGMPNKEAVPFPSEVPEIRSMLMNEDASRFNSASPIQFNERTMFVKIHSLEYRISCQVLELVFSRFGILEDVEILHSGSEFHSRIRFMDRESAIDAFKALNGRNIYDGCCQMELFLDVLNNKKLSEIEAPMAYASSGLNQVEPPIEGASSDRLNGIEAPIDDANSIEAVNQVEEMENSDDKLEQPTEPMRSLLSEDRSTLSTDQEQNSFNWEIEPMVQIQSCAYKVFDELPNSKSDFGVSTNLGVNSATIQKSFEKPVLEASPKALKLEINPTTTDRSFSIDYELNGNLPSLSLEFPMFGDFIWARQDEKHSRNCGIFYAHHMFEKMPVRRSVCSDYSAQVGSGQLQLGNWVFDPGARFVDGFSYKDHKSGTPNCKNNGYFRELQGNFESFYVVMCNGLSKQVITSCEKDQLEESCDSMIFLGPNSEMMAELLRDPKEWFGSIDSFTFDPGGRMELPLPTLGSLVIIVFDPGILHELELQVVLIGGYWVLAGLLILVFDPGIVSKGDDRSAQLNIECILEQFQVYCQQEIRVRMF